jgi:hypothetical protein
MLRQFECLAYVVLTYVMLKPVHNETDSVQQCHLGLWKLNFLHQRHQAIEHDRRIWQKILSLEFPLIGHSMELPSSGDANDLVVHRIAAVKKMLEDLVDNRLLLFGHLDSNPLRDDDSDAATDDVEARLPLPCLNNQGVFEERVKVELLVEYISCEPNGGIDRVFEENVFVVRSCRRSA